MNKSPSRYRVAFAICVLLLVWNVWMLASGATQDRAPGWGWMVALGLFTAALALPAFGRMPQKTPPRPVLRRPGEFPRVVLIYGVKIIIPARKKKQIDVIEADKDRAKQAGLETISGYMGKTYFCYVGQKLGTVGLDFSGHIHYGVDSLAQISADVRARLKQHGLKDSPSFHLELEG